MLSDERMHSRIKDNTAPMIVLTGPTAVGKTKLSIALSKAVNGEIGRAHV